MTRFKLTIGRLLLIGIYRYQSTNRSFIYSHLFKYSHKGGLSIGHMIKPPLMKMYKQIRKPNLNLHLKRLHLKYKLKVETVTKRS